MAIKTSTFGGWEISGEHIDAFLKVVNDPTPNLLALAAVKRGRKLAEEYNKNGFVVLNPKQEESSQ